MAQTAEDLLIRLDATTEGLRREMRRAEQTTGRSTRSMDQRVKRAMASIQRNLNRAAKAFVAMGAAGGAAVAGLVKSSVDLADQTAKTADRLGTTTEELSKLRFAAEMTGVEQKTLDMALQRMTRRLSEAANGSGEAVGALDELGLSAERLSQMRPDEAFREVADAMQSIPNQTDRVRLAFKLFDSEGVALVNTLAEGRAGINAYGDELERLGGVIDNDTAKAAEEFNNNLNRLKRTFTGTGNELAEELLPQLVEFTDLIKDAETQEAIQGFVKLFANMAINVTKAVAALHGMSEFIGETIAADLGGVAADDPVRIDQRIEEIQNRLKTLREQQAEEEESFLARIMNSMSQSAMAAQGAVAESSANAKAEIQALEKEMEKLLKLRDLNQIFGGRPAAPSPSSSSTESSSSSQGQKPAISLIDTSVIPQAVDQLNELEIKTREVNEVFAESGRRIQNAFGDEIFNAIQGNFENLGEAVVNVMQRIIAEVLAAQAATALLGESFTSGSSTNIGGLIGTAIGAFTGTGTLSAVDTSTLPTRISGFAHDGLTNVPREGTFMLNKGERVIAPEQNRDLSKFLQGGGGGPQITINAPGADAGTINRIREIVRAEMIPQAIQGSVNAVEQKNRRPRFA